MNDFSPLNWQRRNAIEGPELSSQKHCRGCIKHCVRSERSETTLFLERLSNLLYKIGLSVFGTYYFKF